MMHATAVDKGERGIQAMVPVGLDSGAPEFEWDPLLSTNIKTALGNGLALDYPPVQGLPALREAIAVIHRMELGLPHTADQVLVTYGAMQAIFLVCAHVLSPGDEVLLPAPYWFRLPDILANTGARIKVVPTSAATAFKLTAEQLARHIKPETRLLLLVQPNNPSGAIYSHGELDELATVLEQHPQVMVLADEAYNQLPLGSPLPGGWAACESIGSWPVLTDRVFTVNSLSKNYAAAGLRIGYVTGPRQDIEILTERLRLVTLGVCEAQQRAALCMLADRDALLSSLTARLRQRCKTAAQLVTELLGIKPEVPDAGYYFWIDVTSWLQGPFKTDSELAAYFLREANVAVLPGSQCGWPDYLRLTFALPEPLFTGGITRLQQALASLR